MRAIGLLTITGAVSGLGTFAAFLAGASALGPTGVTRLAIALAVANVVALVVDAGTGGVVVERCVASAEPVAVLRAVALRRIALSTLLLVVVAAVLLVAGWSWDEALGVGTLGLSTVIFTMALLTTQALQTPREQGALHVSKAVMSFCLAPIVVAVHLPLSVLLFGLSFAAASPGLVQLARRRIFGYARAPRFVTPAVAVSAVAFGIAVQLPVAVFSIFSPVDVSEVFAVNERTAVGLLALTNAIASVAYPMAARNRGSHGEWLQRLTLTSVAAWTTGFAAVGVPLALALAALTGNDSFSPWVLAPLLAAYAAFSISAVVLGVLYATRATRAIGVWASILATIVSAACLVAGARQAPALAAVGTLVGHVTFFLGVRRYAAREVSTPRGS